MSPFPSLVLPRIHKYDIFLHLKHLLIPVVLIWLFPELQRLAFQWLPHFAPFWILPSERGLGSACYVKPLGSNEGFHCAINLQLLSEATPSCLPFIWKSRRQVTRDVRYPLPHRGNRNGRCAPRKVSESIYAPSTSVSSWTLEATNSNKAAQMCFSRSITPGMV